MNFDDGFEDDKTLVTRVTRLSLTYSSNEGGLVRAVRQLQSVSV